VAIKTTKDISKYDIYDTLTVDIKARIFIDINKQNTHLYVTNTCICYNEHNKSSDKSSSLRSRLFFNF